MWGSRLRGTCTSPEALGSGLWMLALGGEAAPPPELTVPSSSPFQAPHHRTRPQKHSQHPPRSDTSLMAASLLASSSSSSPTPSSGPQTARMCPKRGEQPKEAFPSWTAPPQVSS